MFVKVDQTFISCDFLLTQAILLVVLIGLITCQLRIVCSSEDYRASYFISFVMLVLHYKLN